MRAKASARADYAFHEMMMPFYAIHEHAGHAMPMLSLESPSN